MSTGTPRTRDDRGSALILALAFVFAVGLLILALASLTSNSMLSTSNARAQRTSLNDAETATMTAMQYLRSHYGGAVYDGGVTQQSCLPPNATLPASDPRVQGQVSTVSLWCVANANPTSAATRVVDFYACRANTPFPACTGSGATNLLLHVQVSYDDFPASGVPTCGPASSSTCGTAMSVNTWDIATADS
jgi:hypothetical protein